MKILSFLVSDQIKIDHNTKKATIEGIFDAIYAPNFPAKHKQLIVSVITHGMPGKHRYKVSIMKDDKEISTIDETILTGERHYFIARFFDIIFPEPGIYIVKVFVDKEELSTEIKLNLLK